MFNRISRGPRIRTAGLAVIVMSSALGGGCAAGQETETVTGPPLQVLPYVNEPGVPAYTVPTGTVSTTAGSGGSSSTGETSDGDALETMLGTSWGGEATTDATALGVDPSALAAMCVEESNCNSTVGSNGSAVGTFQMTPAAYDDGLATALAADPSLSSQIVQGPAGMDDPVTESIAADGYLMEANSSLETAGISDPTVLDGRAVYNFGPTNGVALATASPTITVAAAMPDVSEATLAANGISPTETVAQWQASVNTKIGGSGSDALLS